MWEFIGKKKEEEQVIMENVTRESYIDFMSKQITGNSTRSRSSKKEMENNDLIVAWLWGEVFFTFFIAVFLIVLGSAKRFSYLVIIILLFLLVIGLKFLATRVD